MTKAAVGDWSTNDALNTDIGGTDISEGCSPGGINDAIRKVMAQVATFRTSPSFTDVTASTMTASTSIATPILRVDAQYYMLISAGHTVLSFDSNDTLDFDRTNNIVATVINTTTRLAVSATGAAVFGALSATGAITQNGNQVWHAGNITPMPVTGGTFTGVFGRDANFRFDLLSGVDPIILLDANSYILFTRSTKKLTYVANGVGVASIDVSGNVRALGNITGLAGTI